VPAYEHAYTNKFQVPKGPGPVTMPSSGTWPVLSLRCIDLRSENSHVPGRGTAKLNSKGYSSLLSIRRLVAVVGRHGWRLECNHVVKARTV
jgi:hypothetical protein